MTARPTILLLALLLVGCAGVPRGSDLQRQASEANRRGLAQLASGQADRARATFEASLRLAQSIEDESAIARGWYNVSVAEQRLGRLQQAELALDAVLLDDVHEYAPADVAPVALRKAVLALARGDVAVADGALARARSSCSGKCELAGALSNVEARIALARRQPEVALRVLAEARRSRSGPVEAANTDRLQAAALLALGRHAEAEAAARSALAADKRLGQGEKILQDLELLARAARSPAERRGYLQRAADVARARGDAAAADRIRLQLDSGDGSPVPAENPGGLP